MDANNDRERVLLLTPTGRDAVLISGTLREHGIGAGACPDGRALASAIRAGAGAVVIAEEALARETIEALASVLSSQPPWSDLPIVVLSSAGESTAVTNYWALQFGPLGNVTVIERPVRPATLLSVVGAALRARRRQYDVESLLTDVQVAQERLRTLIESVQDYAIINLDLEGRVTYWNAGAQRLLGYTDEQIIGRDLGTIFTEEERRVGAPARMIETALASGLAELEGWRVRADGSRFWASGVIRLTRDESGKPTGFVDVLRDITERRNFEDRQAEQARALQRSNEDLQRFAYVASHDLQEPLRAVSVYSELLARKLGGDLDNDSREYVDFIMSGVGRMRELIRDLLDFSRVASDDARPLERVDTGEIVATAVENLREKVVETGAELVYDGLPTVLANHSGVLQVFQNLIGNAMKYCQTAPRVEVSSVREGRYWKFAVRDNGIGIAPEFHDKVFGLFQRLHDRQTYPGTGIGLATCKRIIERYGGRIWVESDEGRGSTFYFTLPVAE